MAWRDATVWPLLANRAFPYVLTGRRTCRHIAVALTASWGTTETAPAATSAHFASAQCGCIGVPIPGVTLKLVPHGEKRELRVLGPNVTPGYCRNEAATRDAFDEERFYCTGDAALLVDESDPARGLTFDGRLAENFKLATGTWVHAGAVRTRLVSETRVLSDAVICGHNGLFIAALGWLNQTEARRVLGRDDDVRVDDPALVARWCDHPATDWVAQQELDGIDAAFPHGALVDVRQPARVLPPPR